MDVCDSLEAWFNVEEDEGMIVDLTCVICGSPTDGALQCPGCKSPPDARQMSLLEAVRAPFPGRVELLLPWAGLASDNLRKGIIGKANRESHHRYAEALAFSRTRLRAQYTGAPFAGPARVDVVVFVPDNRTRDGWNFGKIIGDSLKGIVLTDDKFGVLEDGRIRRGGVDRDDPRALITVEAIDG